MLDKYNNILSIDPKHWGKCGWIFLNSIALTYKKELKEKYKEFFSMMPYVLPCEACGLNLKKNLVTLDKALEDKESLLNWLLLIRNEIYIEQKRKTKTLTENIDEIFYQNQNKNDYKIYFFIVLLIVLIIIYFIYFYAKQNN
jgi:hypothetical protein